MTRPNLFLVGPPRSATTSLAMWLAEHPEVLMSRPKEPAYHVRDLPMGDRVSDRSEYLRLFANAEDAVLRGDATPWYLFASSAPASIHEMSPDAKIVVGLRHPVDVLASLHNHHLFVGLEQEANFEKAVLMRRATSDPSDFRIGVDYISVVRFGEQVERYLSLFPREQIFPVVFDEITSDPARVFPELVASLGAARVGLAAYPQLNPARHHRNETLRRLIDMATDPVAETRWGRAIRKRLSRANTKRGRLGPSRQIRERIMSELDDDVRLLERLLDVDLTSWREPAQY